MRLVAHSVSVKAAILTGIAIFLLITVVASTELDR